jgi:hypothetical protein
LKEFDMLPSSKSACRRGLQACIVVLASWNWAAFAQPTEVGRVSLHIGQAWVVRADGTRLPLARGAAIFVGDRVETAANGHVHMRFIDNAAVSVRPDSVLQVQAYTYDAERPQSNEIRLLVEKGTSRSISGAATDVDKSRFRLNTPIAAIGIRGTDFIVQTDPAGDKASVADGTIVMSPLGGACSAAGLGPCAGAHVRELSAEMGRLMAVVRAGEHATRIVPGDSLNMTAAAANERLQSRGDRSVTALRASGLLAAEPTESEARRGNDAAAAGLLTLASTGANLNRPSSLTGQLIWGHWAIQSAELDRLSVPFSLASLGRHVTVADAETGLFRSNQSVPGELFPASLQGTVEFRLNRATAMFEAGDRSESAAISRSNLTIDFTRRTFATGLDLKSESGVSGELRMAGNVRSDGLFVLREGPIDQRAEQRVAGAISLNGREAGYLFERSAGGGWFRGRTLWGP